MRSPATRTLRTSLTDDELILFDGLFDVWDTLESLLRENYSTWHNLPHSHELDASALTHSLQALLDRGLIQSRTEHRSGRDMTWFALTERGGDLWMLERQPVWERYCVDDCWPAEAGGDAWLLSVRSPLFETASAFLNAAVRCRLYEVDMEHLTVERKPAEALIPWKTFDVVYELRVPVSSPAGGHVDWDLYEKERTWWRNLNELGELRIARR